MYASCPLIIENLILKLCVNGIFKGFDYLYLYRIPLKHFGFHSSAGKGFTFMELKPEGMGSLFKKSSSL